MSFTWMKPGCGRVSSVRDLAEQLGTTSRRLGQALRGVKGAPPPVGNSGYSHRRGGAPMYEVAAVTEWWTKRTATTDV